MKTAHQFSESRPIGIRILLLTACLSGWTALETVRATPASSETEAPPQAQSSGQHHNYSNWFRFSATGPFISGDPAQFMQRHRLPRNTFGGLEELHWEQFIGQDGLIAVDARGIFDNRDHLFRLRLENPEVGFFEAGYREFRSWYDGSGGFFPQNGAWFSLYDEKLGVNRGRIWVAGTLTLPDLPRFDFRYTRHTRNGTKDSLVWGETELTGGFGSRGIVPSFWEFDEVRHVLEGGVSHRMAITLLGVALRYERDDLDGARNMRRRPLEPQDRHLTHREGVDSRLFNAYAFSETDLHHNVLLTAGYSYTSVDSDLSATRIFGESFGAPFDPLFASRQFRDPGIVDLAGTSDVKQHAVHVNLLVTTDAFALAPSLRVERHTWSGVSDYIATNVGSPPALTTTETPLFVANERSLRDVTESIEARYTGIPDWIFFARGEWLQGKGDMEETEIETVAARTTFSRRSDDRRSTRRYTAGLGWYPLARFNLSARYRHRKRINEYEHPVDPRPGRYPAFLRSQDIMADEASLRLRWRPARQLTLGSRFDWRLSTVDSLYEGLAQVQSAGIRKHAATQDITWTPVGRFYVQASLSWVGDRIDSPANHLPGAAAGLVLDSRNDFGNAALMLGLAVSQKTDIEAQYFYFKANNYIDNSLFSQPYGAGATEHGTLLGLTHHLSEGLRWTFRYLFFNNRDLLSGGFNNYEAHQLQTGLEYRF